MKLVTVKQGKQWRLGRVEDDAVTLFDFEGGMLGLIQAGAKGTRAARRATERARKLTRVTLAAPLSNPSKVVCIGLNYADYARAGNITPPARPICFAKFPSSLVGTEAEIRWAPQIATQVDYEAELVVVMGRPARNVSRADALNYIFGYTCGNDITARDLQNSDGQWVRCKSFDTFAPLGPWIVTADEIPDPQNLKIQCSVNGQILQDSHTGQMIFGVAELIEFLSQAFTLMPGDLIYTGTPAGVGVFRAPQVFLREGDEVVVQVEHIGRLVNHCRTHPA